jgi:hypothetical protein
LLAIDTATILPAALADASGTNQKPSSPAASAVSSQVSINDASFSQQYTSLTKKILLTGIELERFSLNYRLNAGKQPRLRKLRYFLAQETGSGGALAFEISGVDQFGTGRNHPLKLSQNVLHGALATALATSIVAGSGSALEFSLNVMEAEKRRKHGFDSKSATKFVLSKLQLIDQLIAERETLVSSNSANPGYARAVVEGRVLQAMRSAFVQEYSEFNVNARSFLAFQNAFFLLNASYNAVAATAAGVAYRGVREPKFNGTANILFIVAGAAAAASPILSSAYGALVKKSAANEMTKEFGEKPHFDLALLSADRKSLEGQINASAGTLMPSFPATQRLALYTESDHLFKKQLDSETKTIRHLEKVALETSELGPAIGSTLMTQGIVSTYGYYHYPVQPRKQIAQLYYGSLVGTVGTGTAVIGNAAWLLSSWSYEHHLAKRNQLPEQLIQARLEHLKELEQTVSAL